MAENKVKRTESFASIFGDDYEETNNTIKDSGTTLKLEEIIPFEKHPFKLYEGDRLNEMIESIKNYGVIVPIVVRKKGLKYETLSGHNRVNAAKEAGLNEIPSLIKDGLTEEEATLIVTETNLMQRSFTDLLHSERAAVIATRHSAMKNQGIRTDLLNEIEKLSKAPTFNDDSTSGLIGQKLNTRESVSEKYGISPRNISRYLRINELDMEMKKQIDEGKIGLYAGVDLSFISKDNQEILAAFITENTYKVDMKKASMLREYDEQGKLNWDTAKSIVSGDIFKGPVKPKAFKVQPTIILKYFKADLKNKDIEKIIEKALEMYFNKQKSKDEIIDEEENEIG